MSSAIPRAHSAQRTTARPVDLKSTEQKTKGDGGLAVFLFSAAVSAALGLAWVKRGDNLISPKTGLGYDLGIVGAVLMLSLVLYPMRKRMKLMRTWGNAANWFRWHMALGIVGPAFIVMHSNFRSESTNATVALGAMLLVAGSGIAGRYLYGRVHRGLYGQKLEARTLLQDAVGTRGQIGGNLAGLRSWQTTLEAFEAKAMAPTTSLASAFGRMITVGGHINRCRREVSDLVEMELERAARANRWDSQMLKSRKKEESAKLTTYFAAVRKAATLGVYERLFSLWHVLHVPLFIILVITAIIHVIAVHLY